MPEESAGDDVPLTRAGASLPFRKENPLTCGRGTLRHHIMVAIVGGSHSLCFHVGKNVPPREVGTQNDMGPWPPRTKHGTKAVLCQ